MVKRVANLVYREIRGLHQAAYVLAFFTFGSQILAIIRDRLLAHTFGAGAELDLYYAAFRVPDLLYVLFASVLSIYVLLPFVNRYTEQKGVVAGTAVLSQIFTIFLIVYTLVAFLLAVLAPWYVPYLFPGFVADGSELILLSQILLLQPFLLGLSSLCGVVTQMNHRFILYALSPLLYNIGIIIGITMLYPLFGLMGLVMGVVVGALGHLLVQVPFVAKSDFSFSITRNIDWKLLKEVLFVSVPRAFTLSINQIVLLLFFGMASVMAVGSVSVFQFAFNLQSVPLAIVGMSYSVAAFPTLSSLYAKLDSRGFNQQVLTAMRHIIFWSVPIIGLVVVLRAQIVRVLLGSGSFDWADTRLTAAVLAVLVMSLVAQALLLLLVRAFYAGGKTLVPLFVAMGSGLLSVILAIWLRHLYVTESQIQVYIDYYLRLQDVWGAEVLVLAVAFTVGQFVQLIVLGIISKRVFKISYRTILRPLFYAIIAMFGGSLASYSTLIFVVDGVNQNTLMGILLQGSVAGIMGIFGVILVYAVLGAKELQEISRSFQTKLFKTDVVKPQ
jgi:putative peptidoglycan lipid II flippase